MAVAAGKRLAPIVYRPTDAVPTALRAANWIFADKIRSVDALVARLIKAADIDPEWIREHSRPRRGRGHGSNRAAIAASCLAARACKMRSAGSRSRAAGRIAASPSSKQPLSRPAGLRESKAAEHQRELYQKALARQLAVQSVVARTTPEEVQDGGVTRRRVAPALAHRGGRHRAARRHPAIAATADPSHPPSSRAARPRCLPMARRWSWPSRRPCGTSILPAGQERWRERTIGRPTDLAVTADLTQLMCRLASGGPERRDLASGRISAGARTTGANGERRVVGGCGRCGADVARRP